MGKLRLRPRDGDIDQEKYQGLLEVLQEAVKLSRRNRIFYDLSPDECSLQARKEFLFIAKAERIPIYTRKLRKAHCLELMYQPAEDQQNRRLSPEAYRNRIIKVLEEAGRPMKKSEIVAKGRLKEATWNLRINELVKMGDVRREGERRHAVYMLVS